MTSQIDIDCRHYGDPNSEQHAQWISIYYDLTLSKLLDTQIYDFPPNGVINLTTLYIDDQRRTRLCRTNLH